MKTAARNTIFARTKGKPRALAISVSLLLLLAIGIILLGLWHAAESSHDAIAINLAGRQRMLSQRIEKDLLKLKYAVQNHAGITHIRQDLAQSQSQFEQTLALLNSGQLTDQYGNTFDLASTQTENSRNLIIQAQKLWLPLQLALLPVISGTTTLPEKNLEAALFIVMRDSESLLQIMDSLTGEIENYAQRKSEKIRIVESTAIALMLVIFGFVLFYFKRQLNQLSESRLLAMRILEKAATAIVVINAQGNIELCNHAAADMFGYTDGKLAGKNFTDILDEPYYLQIGKRVSGERFALDIDLNQIDVAGRSLFISSLYDKTEQQLKEEQLIHRAYHDPLTELPNRILFMDRLAQTIARAHRKNELAAILFIDLDRFKQVNDLLGHAIGDLLLQNVAARLKDCLREGDTLARLGGDEFTMSIEASDIDICVIVTQRILSELNREFNLNGHSIHISGSVGASLYPNNGTDIKQLMHCADIAMYQAKAMGGNTCCKYPVATE